jgi:hypothetical protein
LLLEWYPWENFSEIEQIGKGGYATVFRAKRSVGIIKYWDHQINQWSREEDCDEYVALKTIGDSESKDFINEVTNLYLLLIRIILIIQLISFFLGKKTTTMGLSIT